MRIDNNEMKAKDLAMSAAGILSGEAVVSDFTYQYKTDNAGNRTDIIECVRYKCVDLTTRIILRIIILILIISILSYQSIQRM